MISSENRFTLFGIMRLARRALEAFGTQQRVGEVEQQPRGHEGGERVIEGHGVALLKPFAGVGVSDRRGEQRQGQNSKDEIRHGRTCFLLRRK